MFNQPAPPGSQENRQETFLNHSFTKPAKSSRSPPYKISIQITIIRHCILRLTDSVGYGVSGPSGAYLLRGHMGAVVVSI